MFTIGKHPNSAQRSSVFKWAVFNDGLLFEGFVSKDTALRAVEEYNREAAQYTNEEITDHSGSEPRPRAQVEPDAVDIPAAPLD